MKKLTVIGMGTGDRNTLTIGGFEKAKSANRLVLQTDKVDTADFFRENEVSFFTLDDIYNESEDFDDFNLKASEFILAEDDSVFMVIGEVGQNELVLSLKDKAELEIIPGVALASNALSKALPDDSEEMLIIPALSFINSKLPLNTSLTITEIDDIYTASETFLKLKRWLKEDKKVALINGSEKHVLSLSDAEKHIKYGYDSSIVIEKANLKEKECFSYEDLKEVVKILRDEENGCPWDKVQTHESLKRYIIEEAYEVIEAIENDDMNSLSDELGDVLLQVMFHASIADDMQDFDEYDVLTDICKKMIRRHPVIFGGDASFDSSPDNWELIKKKEKNIDSIKEAVDDIPKSMDILLKTEKLLHRAKKYGKEYIPKNADKFDFKDENEAGKFLLAAIYAMYKKDICPMTALTSEFIKVKEIISKS